MRPRKALDPAIRARAGRGLSRFSSRLCHHRDHHAGEIAAKKGLSASELSVAGIGPEAALTLSSSFNNSSRASCRGEFGTGLLPPETDAPNRPWRRCLQTESRKRAETGN